MLRATAVENGLVIGTDSGRTKTGTGLGYTALAWIGHGGDIFGSSAHFGGGPATATAGVTPILPAADRRRLPIPGLAIDARGNLATTGTVTAIGPMLATGGIRVGAGAAELGGVAMPAVAAGQIDLGNATLAPGPAPTTNFHKPAGSARDKVDLRMLDTGGALRVSDIAGNQLLYASTAAGLQGTQLAATTVNGIAATFNGPRKDGNLMFNLTGSGFDMLQETGTQALYIRTAGGYNAAFDSDGSTTLNGPLAQPASSSMAGFGRTQAGATVLKARADLVTSCASGANAFVLPAGAPAGEAIKIRVINRSGNWCQIYPPAGGQIENGAVNRPVLLASGTDGSFTSMSPIRWYQ